MNVFYLSFGKDSMANLLLAAEQGIAIDHVIYCDIRFSSEISGEHPLMASWIPEAESILYKNFGIFVEHVSSCTYLDFFYSKYKSGFHVGDFHGFPKLRGSWCNRELKMRAISNFRKQFKGQNEFSFVGIASDESYRFDKLLKQETRNRKFRSLLIENHFTENDTFDFCDGYNLLSPSYKSNDGLFRGGCWFCPKQCYFDLYSLWLNYPHYFNLLLSLEPDSPSSFKPYMNLSDFSALFHNGYVPKRRKKRESSIQLDIFSLLSSKYISS